MYFLKWPILNLGEKFLDNSKVYAILSFFYHVSAFRLGWKKKATLEIKTPAGWWGLYQFFYKNLDFKFVTIFHIAKWMKIEFWMKIFTNDAGIAYHVFVCGFLLCWDKWRWDVGSLYILFFELRLIIVRFLAWDKWNCTETNIRLNSVGSDCRKWAVSIYFRTWGTAYRKYHAYNLD